MNSEEASTQRKCIALKPGEGRSYAMGRVSAIFKADCAETDGQYSISEWWLDPHTEGPGAHSHEEDDVFFVIAGTMSILVDGQWIDASTGSFVLIPGGTTHDFQNRSDERAGVLTFAMPGNFENHMPDIVKWYEANPAKDA